MVIRLLVAGLRIIVIVTLLWIALLGIALLGIALLVVLVVGLLVVTLVVDRDYVVVFQVAQVRKVVGRSVVFPGENYYGFIVKRGEILIWKLLKKNRDFYWKLENC